MSEIPFKEILQQRITDIEGMKEVYLLLVDWGLTLTSGQNPFGVAVSTEAEAIKFKEDKSFGFSRDYEKIGVFDTAEKATAGIKPVISKREKLK